VYLLDTNACIDFLERKSETLVARVGEAFGTLAVSTISAAELLVGSAESTDPDGDRRTVERFLAGVVVHDFDLAMARRYGDVIRKIGVRRKSFDRLIGVQALMLGLVLITRNPKDFADVPGLKVENWTV
jgi:tRNA(fMet)-specific endonuclease VapC